MNSPISRLVRRGRTWLWALPALAWLSFCAWYTNLSGPLSQDEIAAFTAQMERSGRPAEAVQRLRRFMAEDSGDQFLMANLIDMADADETAPLSAEASMDRYMAHMYPELFRRASRMANSASSSSSPLIPLSSLEYLHHSSSDEGEGEGENDGPIRCVKMIQDAALANPGMFLPLMQARCV